MSLLFYTFQVKEQNKTDTYITTDYSKCFMTV